MRANRSLLRSSHAQMPPALRAAMSFLVPMIILRFLSAFATGIWWLFVLGIVYLLNGYVAGRLYAISIYHARGRQAASNAIQHGAGAGVILFVLGWIGYVVLVVLIKLFVPLTPFTQIEFLLVCGGFLEFLSSLGFGAFGASRYR